MIAELAPSKAPVMHGITLSCRIWKRIWCLYSRSLPESSKSMAAAYGKASQELRATSEPAGHRRHRSRQGTDLQTTARSNHDYKKTPQQWRRREAKPGNQTAVRGQAQPSPGRTKGTGKVANPYPGQDQGAPQPGRDCGWNGNQQPSNTPQSKRKSS